MTRALDLSPDEPPVHASRVLAEHGLREGMICHSRVPVVTTAFRDVIRDGRRMTSNRFHIEGELFWWNGWSLGWWEPIDKSRPTLSSRLRWTRTHDWQWRTHDWKHGTVPIDDIIPGRRSRRVLDTELCNGLHPETLDP